ncbi:hypothetical protein F0562_007625 [Nyssa sinensis]|uniref:Uncharacterized protein n=1 Tax=Nyssa sinensis TaxID=561372 RepID=A0A5J5A5L1_9ASTE|nr:hypothetical protein F0562_007625 [Nyssa sinensis]
MAPEAVDRRVTKIKRRNDRNDGTVAASTDSAYSWIHRQILLKENQMLINLVRVSVGNVVDCNALLDRFWQWTVKDGNSVQVKPEQEEDGSLGCVATGKELMMMPVPIRYTGLRLIS